MHTMKKFIALALVALGITVSARAQWIVYDPANTVQSVINTAQEIAKYIEMNGATVTRREAPYLPVAAVQKTTDNFLSVSTEATARRIALKEEIARTTTALKSATTDAEVQKLTGALIGLSSALNKHGLRNQSGDRVRVGEDVANRNDRSWWDIIGDLNAFTVELLITGILWLVGHFASLLLF